MNHMPPCELQIIKFTEDNREKSYDSDFSKRVSWLLVIKPNTIEIIEKLFFIKIENFSLPKTLWNKWEDMPEMEKVTANEYLLRNCYSNRQSFLKNQQWKNKQTKFKKWTKLWIEILSKKIHIWHLSIWKNV
jgi:hypothetical protein